MNTINQVLKTITLNGKPITLKVVSDDQPEMELAYKLWYEVYIEELKYPLIEGVNHDEKTLRLKPNGSIVFLALDGEKCVGTIRTTHEKDAELEFDYKTHISDKSLIEVSKMITIKSLRRTGLNTYLMNETQIYNGNRFGDYYIVMNTASKMVAFYFTMFFFKVKEEKIIHPEIKNESYLMACTKYNFDKVCSDLIKIAEGNKLTKAKWGLKYYWYKTFTK